MQRHSALLLAAALLAATPALADIDDLPSGSGKRCDACVVGLAVVAGVVDLAFVTVDVVLLATGGEFLSLGWGVVEALLGAGHAIVGGIVTPLGILGVVLNARCAGDTLLAGISLLVVGTAMLIHGIMSAVKSVQRKLGAKASASDDSGPGFAIAPINGGAMAALAWRF